MSRENKHTPPTAAPAVQLRLRAIACEILYREMCLIAANSPNIVDLEFLPKGLHDLGPEAMRAAIQERLDAVDAEAYQYTVLGYGLCSNGTAGLAARRTPVVIPRAHDCITLFFGSKEAYQAYFDRHPGTYFRTTGWCERDFCRHRASIQNRLGLNKPYEEYLRLYGQENADFIREMLGSWERHYDRMVYIDTGIANFLPYAAQAEEAALKQGWSFERVVGSLNLLAALLNGPWLDERFLVLEQGQVLAPTHDQRVVDARPEGPVPAAG